MAKKPLTRHDLATAAIGPTQLRHQKGSVVGPVIIYRKDRAFASFALLTAGNVAAQVIRDDGVPYSTIIPGLVLTGIVPLGIARGWRWAWWALAALQVVALIGDLALLDWSSALAIGPAIGLWLLMSGHRPQSQTLADHG